MSAKVQIIFHFNKKIAMKVTFQRIIFLFPANLLVVGRWGLPIRLLAGFLLFASGATYNTRKWTVNDP